MRVTQLLGLPARQSYQPGFRLGRDYRIASRTRPIIQRLDHPQFRRSLKTACHGLLRHPNRARHGIDRRVFQIGQDNPRPFDTARRFGPRPGNLQQTLPLLRISRQRDHSTRCYHWIPQSNPPPSILPHLVQNGKIKPNILIFWNLYTRSSWQPYGNPADGTRAVATGSPIAVRTRRTLGNAALINRASLPICSDFAPPHPLGRACGEIEYHPPSRRPRKNPTGVGP